MSRLHLPCRNFNMKLEFKIQDTCSSLNVLEIYFSNAKTGQERGVRGWGWRECLDSHMCACKLANVERI